MKEVNIRMIKYGNNITLSDPVRFTKNEVPLVEKFNCGNEIINDYLKKEAHNDPQTTTFIVVDNDTNDVICYYSLSCSGFVLNNGNNVTIYPAVEIKMFAIDESYQHLPYSEDVEDGGFSDVLLGDVISYINYFTDNNCGADKIILYAVPKAENFYRRSGFEPFKEFMLQSTSLFIDGCIPMYFDL